MKGKDLKEIYSLRQNFVIIGLTGRTGAGCTEVANILSSNSFEETFGAEIVNADQFSGNSTNIIERKRLITYNFLHENWFAFKTIRYRDVLTSFIIENGIDNFMATLVDTHNYNSQVVPAIVNYKELYKEFKEIFDEGRKFKEQLIGIKIDDARSISALKKVYEFYFESGFLAFSERFHQTIERLAPSKGVSRMLLLQQICNGLRRGGKECYHCEPSQDLINIYTISKRINRLIKAYHNHCRATNVPCRVVIDSLRNSLEIMYFKERYSGFYMFAINAEEAERTKRLEVRYGKEIAHVINSIDQVEYENPNKVFYRQDVQNCLQKSDVYINNVSNELVSCEQCSEKLNLKQQLIKFIALAIQPGIVTPSSEERCMQVAVTAKYNSGCISRQVGAAITDENFSIKAIGWNDTPQGQVPCLLRNIDDLIDDKDHVAFSPYERSELFIGIAQQEYKPLNENRNNLCGRSTAFCFKALQNSLSEGKNQVHTRSLHAEENAFLQITKYGGQGIKNGILFTTASPCELCSKKAYQLGISKVFYIDPYPGISRAQILETGVNQPIMVLFSGAIGRAYSKLYDPFMAYKDELSLTLGLNIQDQNKKLINTNKELQARIKQLEREIQHGPITRNV